ncbi:MAG: hypothetical protein A2Y73_04960 [Chloroflexi bacterium RBG_13_56_8]|nr:MAG: hypothetical protein A2Y73_04960 [Chloroflexi bacterium RBG_13_56_8]
MELLLALTDRGGKQMWEQTLEVAGGTFPIENWRQGEIVRDIQQVHLPPNLPPGTYRLTLQPNQAGSDRPYILEKVTVKPRS